jgi:hypothetical protein
LDSARTRLRVSTRPRDHSADNVLSTAPALLTYTSSVQRSTSFKRPQETNETKLIHRSIFRIKKNQEEEPEENSNDSRSYSSSQEHIYDNLDLFKRHKTNLDMLSNDNDSSTNAIVIKREHSIPITHRLRPVTMLVPTNNDKQFINEFENVFNQLKKCGSIKKIQPKEEIIPLSPPPQEPVQPLPPSIPIEQKPAPFLIENEPIIPVFISTNRIIETPVVIQTPSRRKTLGGAHLPPNNKIATEDNKPTPSWIDIAKQKQSKL